MATSRTSFVCSNCVKSLSRASRNGSRKFSTSSTRQHVEVEELPRWKQTPPKMKMPYRIRPTPLQPAWVVNEDDEPLDRMYDAFIGQAGRAAREQGLESTKGRDLLPEQIKWLAVTHKSFDHARRGFNDRLAFLGKRILHLQTSLALLNAPVAPSLDSVKEKYQHPALDGVENVTLLAKDTVLDRTRLANLARKYGVDKVVRWKPRKSDRLESSGMDTVLAHTVYSIIGALALQRGGEVAVRTARERVLQPLGLTSFGI